MDKVPADRLPIHWIPYPKRCESGEGELYFPAGPPFIDCLVNDPGLGDAVAELRDLIITAPASLRAAEATTAPIIQLVCHEVIPHPQGYELHITRAGRNPEYR